MAGKNRTEEIVTDMDSDNKITRRDALKQLGFIAANAVIASSGALSLTSCEEKKTKRVVLYFTGTGNCLYVARQLAGADGETLSIPQLFKQKSLRLRLTRLALSIQSMGTCLPTWCASS